MLPPEIDPYDLLGISKDATTAEIQAAYRERTQYHPERPLSNPQNLQRIHEAYEMLSDHRRRDIHDKLRLLLGPRGEQQKDVCETEKFMDTTMPTTDEKPPIPHTYDPVEQTILSGGTDHHRHVARMVTLPMVIGTESVIAIPDTGSDWNAISTALVANLGFEAEVSTESHATFQLANGTLIQSIGTLRTTYSFHKPQPRSVIEFHVFSRLAVPLIVGKDFLQATETLTKYTCRLLTSYKCSTGSTPRILHLNRPTRRLRCYVGVNLVYANADTGAEMNLSSPEFAIRRGFRIEEPQSFNQEVILADGSRVPIRGRFKTRFDAYQPSNRETRRFRSHEKYFYILDGLTSDILLSNDLLFEISAFETQQQSFVDGKHLLHPGLNLVTWLSQREKWFLRRHARGSSANPNCEAASINVLEAEFQQQLDEDDAYEHYRRQIADKQILTDSAAERQLKATKEAQRRQQYDASRANKLQEHRKIEARESQPQTS